MDPYAYKHTMDLASDQETYEVRGQLAQPQALAKQKTMALEIEYETGTTQLDTLRLSITLQKERVLQFHLLVLFENYQPPGSKWIVSEIMWILSGHPYFLILKGPTQKEIRTLVRELPSHISKCARKPVRSHEE